MIQPLPRCCPVCARRYDDERQEGVDEPFSPRHWKFVEWREGERGREREREGERGREREREGDIGKDQSSSVKT